MRGESICGLFLFASVQLAIALPNQPAYPYVPMAVKPTLWQRMTGKRPEPQLQPQPIPEFDTTPKKSWAFENAMRNFGQFFVDKTDSAKVWLEDTVHVKTMTAKLESVSKKLNVYLRKNYEAYGDQNVFGYAMAAFEALNNAASLLKDFSKTVDNFDSAKKRHVLAKTELSKLFQLQIKSLVNQARAIRQDAALIIKNFDNLNLLEDQIEIIASRMQRILEIMIYDYNAWVREINGFESMLQLSPTQIANPRPSDIKFKKYKDVMNVPKDKEYAKKQYARAQRHHYDVSMVLQKVGASQLFANDILHQITVVGKHWGLFYKFLKTDAINQRVRGPEKLRAQIKAIKDTNEKFFATSRTLRESMRNQELTKIQRLATDLKQLSVQLDEQFVDFISDLNEEIASYQEEAKNLPPSPSRAPSEAKAPSVQDLKPPSNPRSQKVSSPQGSQKVSPPLGSPKGSQQGSPKAAPMNPSPFANASPDAEPAKDQVRPKGPSSNHGSSRSHKSTIRQPAPLTKENLVALGSQKTSTVFGPRDPRLSALPSLSGRTLSVASGSDDEDFPAASN